MSSDTEDKPLSVSELSTICLPYKVYHELLWAKLFDKDPEERAAADEVVRLKVKYALQAIENGERPKLPNKYFEYVKNEDERLKREMEDKNTPALRASQGEFVALGSAPAGMPSIPQNF